MLSDRTFEDKVLRATSPTLVMLWQRECAPCKALVPILVAAAKERGGVQFMLMNSEDNPKTKARYGVTACPTMMLFRDGQMLGRWMGAAPKEKVLAWIDRTLGGAVLSHAG